MGVRPGIDADLAGRLDAYLCGFIQACAGAQCADDGRRGYATSLDIGREADPEVFALLAGFGLLFAEIVIAYHFQGPVENSMVVATVVLQGHLRLVACLGHSVEGRDEIFTAQLGGVHVHFHGSRIHEALQDIGCLRATSTAVGIHCDGMGEHTKDFHIDLGRRIKPLHQGAVQVGRHCRGEGGQVSTQVGMRRDFECSNLAVFVKAHVCFGDMVAPVGVGDERLASVGGPFYRSLELPGAPGHEGFFCIVEDFAAKATSYVGSYYAYFMLGDTQYERAHQEAGEVWVLRGGIQGVFVIRLFIVADGAARFHRVGSQSLIDDIHRCDVVGCG